ncbi:MAG TPA: hypothetical protein VFL69_07820 [Marmoricola sp.]|nr:hypothetical protein [Marmoricola sp.]
MPKNSDTGPHEPNLELPSLGFRRRGRRPVRAEEPDPEPETTATEPDRVPAPAPAPTRPVGLRATDEPEAAPVRRERRPSPLTRVPPPYAAAMAGIACGFVGVVLTSLALHACEAVRGVGSCGGIGLFALLLILVLEILIGAALLKACGVPDSFSTSFLGVGLVAVVIMLFLLSRLDSPWMLLVIPLVTAAAFVASWLVTRTFVEVD